MSNDEGKYHLPGSQVSYAYQPGTYGIVIATEPEPEIDEDGAIQVHGDARLVMWTRAPTMIMGFKPRKEQSGNLRWHRAKDLQPARQLPTVRVIDNMDDAIKTFGGFNEHLVEGRTENSPR